MDISQFEQVKQEEREYRILDEKDVIPNMAALWGCNDDLKDYLTIGRGLTQETLEHFKIGAENRQITIPVYK